MKYSSQHDIEKDTCLQVRNLYIYFLKKIKAFEHLIELEFIHSISGGI